MDSLRVAMILQRYYPLIGGAERFVASLSGELKTRGVDVHVITRRYPGLSSYELVDDIPVHRLPVPGPKVMASLSFTLTALPLIGRLRPDIIHAQEVLSPATTAVIAKSLFNIPIVVTVQRGGAIGELNRLMHIAFGKFRFAILRSQVDMFITINEEIKKELIDLGVPKGNCEYIPNCVDTSRFKPLNTDEKAALRGSLGIPEGPVVIYAGRLVPEKRVDQLISVWQSVLQVYPQALLLILGAGPEEAALKAAAGNGIKFLGAKSDVAPYLQAVDLFVLPSMGEGLSVAVLEALACGLPVIATAVGGTPEIIHHLETGWLIPPDDPKALLTAITTLLNDKITGDRIGKAGRTLVEEGYSLTAITDRSLNLYTRIVQQYSHLSPKPGRRYFWRRV